MGNLLGREGRRCEKKEKKKEEKRRRGEIKTSQYLRRGEMRERIPKTTQPHPQNTCSWKRILNNIPLIHHTHKLLLFLKRILLLLHISGRRGRGGRRGRERRKKMNKSSQRNKKKQQ